ncbi:unnamed protein product [Microthlaspi erraticum]|uniref:Uncharacterized protein n=1 Tax=Microthlaspi erraticum TaxID=1685480 RepID=A0A6D2JXS0_9BRAS|nr:unnamed protein product [Microthlaspi erraticum]
MVSKGRRIKRCWRGLARSDQEMMAESLIGEIRSNEAKGRRLGIRSISDGDKRNDPMTSHGLGETRLMTTTAAVIHLTQAGAELEGSEKSPTVWLKTWAATK